MVRRLWGKNRPLSRKGREPLPIPPNTPVPQQPPVKLVAHLDPTKETLSKHSPAPLPTRAYFDQKMLVKLVIGVVCMFGDSSAGLGWGLGGG